MIINSEDYAEALVEAAEKGRLVTFYIKLPNGNVHEFPRATVCNTESIIVGTVIFKPETEYPLSADDPLWQMRRGPYQMWACIAESTKYPYIKRLHIHY